MILVLLGTQNNSFSRLLEQIEKCIKTYIIKEKVVVQAGATNFESKKMEIFDYRPKEEIQELIQEASFVITHGGVGSITNCLKKNKKVIAVPRVKKFNEHVNDHQIQIVKDFDDKGYIKGVFELEDLPKVIKNIAAFKPKSFESGNSKILKLISDFIDNN